jgi:hypothetical protein
MKVRDRGPRLPAPAARPEADADALLATEWPRGAATRTPKCSRPSPPGLAHPSRSGRRRSGRSTPTSSSSTRRSTGRAFSVVWVRALTFAKRLRWPPAVVVDAGLPVPDQRARQPTEALQAPGDPGQQVVALRREHQDTGARARVAQTRDHHPAAPRLAVARRGSPRAGATHRTGRSRPVDRPSAETSSPPARTAAGSRASNHRRPSWTPCTRAARAARGFARPATWDRRAAAGESPP